MRYSLSLGFSFSTSLVRETESKETQLREHVRKIESLEDACLDLEGTIEQFRDLVLRLQKSVFAHVCPSAYSRSQTLHSELNDLRNQTQTAQSESATAASQTAQMMSLNLKLQSSAAKSQAKQIEYEIKKLEAKEARELLTIVQVGILSYLYDLHSV